jgi:hypothetical protein
MTLEEALALPAGAELDALVAEQVMGWPLWRPESRGGAVLESWGFDAHGRVQKVVERRETTAGREGWWTCPELWSPSTDIAAAWEVVTDVSRTLKVEVYRDGHTTTFWMCSIEHDDNSEAGYAVAETAPLAICRAALKACWKE